MSDLIKGVFDLCEQFIVGGKGQHVTLKEEGMEKLAEDIKTELAEVKDHWLGYPKSLTKGSDGIAYEMLCYELIADSINYQYWYGKHSVRPNGACANVMYDLLNQAFNQAREANAIANIGYSAWELCEDAIEYFINYITFARFPDLENRIRHIKEVRGMIKHGGMDTIKNLSNRIVNNNISVNDFLSMIVNYLPGYANDLFLKRAFLLPIMLYRRVQWFKDEVDILPVPADYQIPKMLEGLGCIGYDYILSEKIQGSELIASGSLMECEIRAATMLAGRRIAELSGHTMCDVDTYLWLKRNTIDKPFHLTVTTSY